MQNSLELNNNKENHPEHENSEPETSSEDIKVRKGQKGSESNFWKIFCCKADWKLQMNALTYWHDFYRIFWINFLNKDNE